MRVKVDDIYNDIYKMVTEKGFKVIKVKQWAKSDAIYCNIAGGRKTLIEASNIFNDYEIETKDGIVKLFITVRA